MPAAEIAAIALNVEGNILCTWINNTGSSTAKANDKVVLVAYFPEIKQTVFSICDATRVGRQAILVTSLIQGYAAETWIGFLSHDDKDAANSTYAGSVEL